MTGVVDNLVANNSYYIEADVEVSENLDTTNYMVGFSNINMSGISGNSNLLRADNGKIFAYFTYSPQEHGRGIHLMKNWGIDGVVKNIRCINTTPNSDQSNWTVNTSSVDRTQTTVEQKENLLVGETTQTVSFDFYIHSRTINGIKYAVSSTGFDVSSSSEQITVGSLIDLGSGTSGAGYYDNVVQIPLTVTFNLTNPFPDNNVESFINVTGSATLAIDQ